MTGISRDRVGPILLAISLHLLLLLLLVFATDFFDLFREREKPEIVHAVMVSEMPETARERRKRTEVERRRQEEIQRQQADERLAEETRREALAAEQRKQEAEAEQKKRDVEIQRQKEAEAKRQAAEAEKQREVMLKAELERRKKELNCERVIQEQIKSTDGQNEELKRHIDDCWAQEQKRLADAEVKQKKDEEAKRKAEEARKQAELDAKRKAIEEEAKRKKAEEDKLKADAERKRKEEEARLRAERARIEQQRQDELIAESAALERASAERAQADLESELSGAASTWAGRIKAIVTRNWSRPPGSREDFECDVWVRIDNQGVVKDVRVTRSSGEPVIDRSVISAVLKSSPLPLPEDLRVLDLYNNSIEFLFKPR